MVYIANPVTVVIPNPSGIAVLSSGYNIFNINNVFLPSGGTGGQVVTKSGPDNYAADWADAASGGGDDVLVGSV